MDRPYKRESRYHLMHALALGLVAYVCSRTPAGSGSMTGYLFQAGIVLFSGSLYALALTNITKLGAVTPFGGLCFLAGWAVLVWTAYKL
jgi:uncharacterized membrane protein YgdD (TMEM256/DUF423 family)